MRTTYEYSSYAYAEDVNLRALNFAQALCIGTANTWRISFVRSTCQLGVRSIQFHEGQFEPKANPLKSGLLPARHLHRALCKFIRLSLQEGEQTHPSASNKDSRFPKL